MLLAIITSHYFIMKLSGTGGAGRNTVNLLRSLHPFYCDCQSSERAIEIITDIPSVPPRSNTT